MKNIPIFTGENGIASLILREIPIFGRAYVLVQSVWNDRKAEFLEECRQFCRAVGTDEIYATWKLEELPAAHAYDMLTMSCRKAELPKPNREVALESLTPENGADFMRIYNERFREVPSAASYDKKDLERLYGQDKAWLARVDGAYAGIAEISETDLESLAVLPAYEGLGYDLALAVLPMVPRLEIGLKVAETNHRAIRLYERLGFRHTGVVGRWWKLEK